MYNKYQKWYNQIISRAICSNRKKLRRNKEGYVYYELHHILPKCCGGEDIAENLVLLTAKEHYICHLLLPKFTEGKIKHKLINALIRMTFAKSKGQERYTARSHDTIRKLIAEKNAEMFRGVSKSLETRARMKGNNGKWKRTEHSSINQSTAQKKRFEDISGTFRGKKHTESTKELLSKQRQGKTIGKRFYTNGTKDVLCYPGEQPHGYVRGFTNNRWRNRDAPQEK